MSKSNCSNLWRNLEHGIIFRTLGTQRIYLQAVEGFKSTSNYN